VSAGSVIPVYYASDYETTLFAYILPDGAATSGNAIAADNGDTVSYRVAVYFGFQQPVLYDCW
jgi:hypothetical protein